MLGFIILYKRKFENGVNMNIKNFVSSLLAFVVLFAFATIATFAGDNPNANSVVKIEKVKAAPVQTEAVNNIFRQDRLSHEPSASAGKQLFVVSKLVYVKSTGTGSPEIVLLA